MKKITSKTTSTEMEEMQKHPTKPLAMVFEDETYHLLKVSDYGIFWDIIQERKKFEYRLNDRGFAFGDMLVLCLWQDEFITDSYCFAQVNYLLQGGQYGIPEGYCIMGITEFIRFGLRGMTNDEILQRLIQNHNATTDAGAK